MRTQSTTRLVMLCAGLACALAVAGPQDGVRSTLRLRTGEVDLQARASLIAERGVFVRGTFGVIQIDGAMTPAKRSALVAAGAVLHDYLPDHAYLADLSSASKAQLRALQFVRTVSAYDDAWKLDPSLAARAGGGAKRTFKDGIRNADERAGLITAAASLFPGVDPASAWNAIKQAAPSATLVSIAKGEVVMKMARGHVLSASRASGVRLVDELGEIELRDNTVNWIVQSNQASVTPFYSHGLTGVGQILGVIDTRCSPDHCAFQDTVNPIGALHRKIQAYNATTGYTDHGTRVASIALGDPQDGSESTGVAYGARMVFNTPPSTTETGVFSRFDLHRTQGAFIHTNSWGLNTGNQYTGVVRAVDDFSWQHDDNLVIFAVANSSSVTIKIPENAKNCLAVAGCGDTPSQEVFTEGASGPTYDGRRKPEVLAPGTGIQGATLQTGCSVAGGSGTSYAAPAVAGLATLMREYFVRGYYPTGAANGADARVPSGALLKALLINCSQDLSVEAGYPGNREGWGRVLGDSVLYFGGDARRMRVLDQSNNVGGALSTGQSAVMRVRAAISAEPMRVTLAFHDAPAAVNAASAAVNDLDLVVRSPAGWEYLGNVFVGGFSEAGGSADAINNVEQVHREIAEAGVWTITINASAVNVGAQGYGLVVTGAVYCPSDVNTDGFVNALDYDAFAEDFEAGDAGADFDGNGFVNALDYDAFAEAFEAGC
ncbi:MAG: S8 family serine peptidase [Phycisphaerales bacterium]|nr:S8 family serine peptidase [Phycisphaerales bacterium]